MVEWPGMSMPGFSFLNISSCHNVLSLDAYFIAIKNTAAATTNTISQNLKLSLKMDFNNILSFHNEEWKPIPGYEGLYLISNYGRVKSLPRLCKPKSNGKSYLIKERILKPSKHSYGYLKYTLCKESNLKYVSAHRLVASAFLDNPANLPVVNHIDCDPNNNHVSNLEWCTSSYNTIHSYKKGRMPDNSDENNGHARINGDVARIIVSLRYDKELTISEISKLLNVSTSIINAVIRGKRWVKYTGLTKSALSLKRNFTNIPIKRTSKNPN